MQWHWLGSKKWLVAGAMLAGVMLGAGLWLARYLGVFAPDILQSGPVIVDVEESLRQPDPVAYHVEAVAEGLDVPWSAVFTSPNRILVSERSGAIRIIENGQLKVEPLVTFTDVSSRAEEGLMGLALDPDYEQNKLVYACMAVPAAGALADKVVRFADAGTTASSVTTIIENLPAAQYHAGCRLGFGFDKKLYITVGDATDKNIAQDAGNWGGKILRINSDGSLPADNPFPASPVWSLGHRNVQGLAWQPGTGNLFATEHGPSGFDGPAGGDEVNIIAKGANYGWPVVSHENSDARFVSPLLVFTPAVAPAGAAFYTGGTLPQFTNNLFFAGLKGEGLFRVVLSADDPRRVVQYEKIEGIDLGRIRDVIDGPDGLLYFMSSNRDGRGSVRPGDDKIYRLIHE